jgi:cell surface protein SprA
VDNLNQQNDKQPDGYFDFLEGVTIDSQNGRIMFPVLGTFWIRPGKQLNSCPSEQDLASPVCVSAACMIQPKPSRSSFSLS